jgi:neutral ceramidase
MKANTIRRICLLILLACGTQSVFDWKVALGADTRWQAGTARVKITPEQSMWMAGYASRSQPAQGKYVDLWAKALLLDDGRGNQGVIVSLDLIGMDRELATRICQTLQSRYDLKRAEIALCFSHTHTGPVVGVNLEPLHYRQLDKAQQELVDQYVEELQGRLVDLVGRASEGLQPCSLSWGSGSATFAVNRRNNRESDVPRLRTEGALKGPVDHDVPVLAVRDHQGRLKAVVFGYACHATVLSDYSWSGDYPGFAMLELETRQPGCMAMFWAGCGADQNPLPRRSLELAQDYGKQLADAVSKVLAQPMESVTGPLACSFREVPLALDQLPSADQLKDDLESENQYVRARARMLLDQLANGDPIAASYPYSVGVWEMGDQVHLVLLGGEVVVDYAIRLKDALRGRRTWVAGYANDVMAYIPSERVLREGGYEGATAMVYYGLPTAWQSGVEQTVVGAVLDMMVRQQAAQ